MKMGVEAERGRGPRIALSVSVALILAAEAKEKANLAVGTAQHSVEEIVYE